MLKRHIAYSDKPLEFFNIDVTISVGYRVKSLQGTRFRHWATRTLREHPTQGDTLNRQRLEANDRELEAALLLVRKALQKLSAALIPVKKRTPSKAPSGLTSVMGI